jgi:GntR family transcriptional regulator/MocR family aminotransferase
MQSLVAAKHVCDRQTPILLQSSLCDFMTQGHFNRHLVRARRLCGRRRAALLRAISEHLGSRVSVEGANAGVHVMMWHADRPAADVPRMVEQAAEVGIGIYPIAPYFMHPPRRAGFLLGYASMEEDMIHEGIKRLARIFV